MPVLIIAEVGSVHDGSFGNSLSLIGSAAECGVDAVKFQTHIAEAETLPGAPMPPFFKGEPRFEYFKRTGFTLQQWQQLKARCEEHSVRFMSSPFSEAAVDLLESVGLDLYKIPSGEITNLPMLDKIAKLNKPVLLSSGMSSWRELDAAIQVVRNQHTKITVLQCTSEYPCPYEHVGLNVMNEMRERYQVPVGLSDHTLTPYATFAAVTLGASVIEKHFTLSRRMYGSDAPHSLEPVEMKDLVRGVRAIETMLSSQVNKEDTSSLSEMKTIFEKSLVVVTDIPAATVLTRDMIGIKKPGTGLRPDRLAEVIGKRTARALKRDSILTSTDIEWKDDH
jgi:N,N'-diacetyllegionaminate synthase